jgi:hypothetical protein
MSPSLSASEWLYISGGASAPPKTLYWNQHCCRFSKYGASISLNHAATAFVVSSGVEDEVVVTNALGTSVRVPCSHVLPNAPPFAVGTVCRHWSSISYEGTWMAHGEEVVVMRSDWPVAPSVQGKDEVRMVLVRRKSTEADTHCLFSVAFRFLCTTPKLRPIPHGLTPLTVCRWSGCDCDVSDLFRTGDRGIRWNDRVVVLGPCRGSTDAVEVLRLSADHVGEGLEDAGTDVGSLNGVFLTPDSDQGQKDEDVAHPWWVRRGGRAFYVGQCNDIPYGAPVTVVRVDRIDSNKAGRAPRACALVHFGGILRPNQWYRRVPVDCLVRAAPKLASGYRSGDKSHLRCPMDGVWVPVLVVGTTRNLSKGRLVLPSDKLMVVPQLAGWRAEDAEPVSARELLRKLAPEMRLPNTDGGGVDQGTEVMSASEDDGDDSVSFVIEHMRQTAVDSPNFEDISQRPELAGREGAVGEDKKKPKRRRGGKKHAKTTSNPAVACDVIVCEERDEPSAAGESKESVDSIGDQVEDAVPPTSAPAEEQSYECPASLTHEDDAAIARLPECVFCLGSAEDGCAPTYAFIPCGHMCCCAACAEAQGAAASHCPFCQAPSMACMRIYAL